MGNWEGIDEAAQYGVSALKVLYIPILIRPLRFKP